MTLMVSAINVLEIIFAVYVGIALILVPIFIFVIILDRLRKKNEPDPISAWVFYPTVFLLSPLLGILWPYLLLLKIDEYKVKRQYDSNGIRVIVDEKDPGILRTRALENIIDKLPESECVEIAEKSKNEHISQYATRYVTDKKYLQQIIDNDNLYYKTRENALWQLVERYDNIDDFLYEQFQKEDHLMWYCFVNITDQEILKELKTWVEQQSNLYEGYMEHINEHLDSN